MRYQHSFIVNAPVAKVAHFHQKMDSFKALNPPPIIVRLHQAVDHPQSGDQMDFTLWLGPLPVRWIAEFSQVSQRGFTDRQIRGPFKRWVHQHRFIELDPRTTEVEDTVEVEIGLNLLAPVAIGMWLGLPLLFAYRSWRTRTILEAAPQADRPGDES